MKSRIKEIRKKLGLNQANFARLGGVQITAQGNYEKGTRVPDANYLISLNDQGIDIMYILTGEHITDKPSKDEWEILNSLRAMPLAKRIKVITEILSHEPNDSDKNDRTIIHQESTDNHGTIIGVGTTKK